MQYSLRVISVFSDGFHKKFKSVFTKSTGSKRGQFDFAYLGFASIAIMQYMNFREKTDFVSFAI